MIDKAAFEMAVKSKWSDSYIFNLEASGCYVDEILEAMFWAWQASRQALECEPVMYTYPEFAADLEGQPEGTATMIPVTRYSGGADLTAPLYTHPASFPETPDSPATGNAVAMGDLTDNDDEEYERSILIQFASVEDFGAAVKSGQCRFTVFGGSV